MDAWIDEGLLGGPEPNAADFQIATSLRLLMTLDDVRPAVEARPAGRLAREVVPEFPGRGERGLPGRLARPAAGSGRRLARDR